MEKKNIIEKKKKDFEECSKKEKIEDKFENKYIKTKIPFLNEKNKINSDQNFKSESEIFDSNQIAPKYAKKNLGGNKNKNKSKIFEYFRKKIIDL